MQQPTGGTPRPDADSTDRDQAPANPPIQRLSGRASRALRDRVRSRAAAVGDVLRTALRPFTSAERALPIAVASIVAVAALLAFLPTTPQGAVGGIQGSAATNPRLAVNGGISRDQQLASALGALNAADGGSGNKVARSTPDPSFESFVIPNEIAVVAPTTGPEPTTGPLANIAAPQPSTGPAATPVAESALFDDGTLIVGPAPDTRVEDGSDLVRSYNVQKGDTVRSVAQEVRRVVDDPVVGEQAQEVDLKVGQELRIPPVSGLVYTVKDTDTLDSVAKRFKIDSAKVVELNGLEDPTLVVGPGARPARRQGAAEAHAQADPEARARRRRQGRGGGGGGRLRRRRRQVLRRLDALAGHRRRQLHQPVLPLRALRDRHRGGLRRQGRLVGAGQGDLRRLEVERRRVPGLDRPRLRALHDVQPHVGDHRRHAARTCPAASRSGASAPAAWPPARTSTSRSGAAGSGTAARASTRCGTSRPAPAGPARPSGRPGGPCDNRPDVPRRCPDLRARRRGRRRRGDDAARGPRPPRRSRRRRRRSRRLRSTSASTPARPRSTTSGTSTTSTRRPAAAASARSGTARPARTCTSRCRPARPCSTARPARCSRTSSRSGRRSWSRRAGAAGLGNTHFATAVHQAPKHAQRGEPGEERLAAAGAPAHRGRRAGGPPERGQVDAARGPDGRAPEDRRLPVHHARAEPRGHGPRASTTGGARRSPTCPG